MSANIINILTNHKFSLEYLEKDFNVIEQQIS